MRNYRNSSNNMQIIEIKPDSLIMKMGQMSCNVSLVLFTTQAGFLDELPTDGMVDTRLPLTGHEPLPSLNSWFSLGPHCWLTTCALGKMTSTPGSKTGASSSGLEQGHNCSRSGWQPSCEQRRNSRMMLWTEEQRNGRKPRSWSQYCFTESNQM